MKRFLLLGLPIWLLCACGAEPPLKFGEEAPHAVRITRQRNYYEAQRQADRLKSMGLAPYLIGHETPSGKYYEVLLGARADYEAMLERRIAYEDDYGLTGLEMVNFNKLREDLVIASEAKAGRRRIDAVKPYLSDEAFSLLRKFPVPDGAKLVSAMLVVSPPDFSPNNLYHVVNAPHDLPRGLKLSSLLPKTTAFAEAKYYDPLLNKGLTVHVMRLREDYTNEEDNLDVPRVFSDQILGTREYETEKSVRAEIDAWEDLSGYRLLITPRKHTERRYMVLRSESDNYLFFFQTTDYEDREIDEIAEGCGRDGGLEQFDSFHNAFFTLPDSPAFEDEFVYFRMNEEMPEEGRADVLDGTVLSEFTFYNPAIGVWGYELHDLHESYAAEARLETTIRQVARKAGRGAVFDTLSVAGGDGVAFSSEKKGESLAESLTLQKGRFLLTIVNREAKLTKQDLKARAEDLQLAQ